MKLSSAAKDTLEKVSGEFESEALADLQEGRSRALAHIEAARRETLEAVEKILETSSRQAESLKRQIIGAAELDARNGQLRTLEKAVEDVFEGSIAGLTRSTSRHEKSLAKLIKEGVDVIGPKASVSCNEKDRHAVSSVLKKLNGDGVKLTLGNDTLETIGGVVLTTPDRAVRFDNTFEARLERLRPALRKGVADILSAS